MPSSPFLIACFNSVIRPSRISFPTIGDADHNFQGRNSAHATFAPRQPLADHRPQVERQLLEDQLLVFAIQRSAGCG